MKRILTAMLLAFCCITASAQLIPPSPTPVFRAFDTNGKPLVGGKLFSFVAGTSIPFPTYTDATGVTPNPNPVILDGTGQAKVFLGQSTYKLVLQNALGVQQWSVDQIIGGGSIVSNPNGTQTITQPDAAHPLTVNYLNVTGNLGANVNGILNATLFPGSDLGAKVANAVTALAGTCGTIYIPNGTYTWSTAITMLPCQNLDGSGAFINVTTSTGPFLTFAGPPTFGTLPATQGGVSHVTFVGPGTGTASGGIQIGIDPAGVITPTYLAYMQQYNEVHIENFGCGISFGNGFQISFMGGAIVGNKDGVCFNIPNVGLENINFHGTQILNNIRYGIYSPQATNTVELNLIACSLDYNGQNVTGGAGTNSAQIHFASKGLLNIVAGHMENNETPFIFVPAASTRAVINITQTQFSLTSTIGGGVYNEFFNIGGGNMSIHAVGFQVAAGGANTVPRLVTWNATGSDNHVFIKDYLYTQNGNLSSLPTFAAGVNPNFYEYPQFNTTGDIVGSFNGPQCTSSANPSVCGSLIRGAVVTVVGQPGTIVQTTAVTANSIITVMPDSTLGTRLGVTCNTTAAAYSAVQINGRTPGSSFAFTLPGGAAATNPYCFTYTIAN